MPLLFILGLFHALVRLKGLKSGDENFTSQMNKDKYMKKKRFGTFNKKNCRS